MSAPSLPNNAAYPFNLMGPWLDKSKQASDNAAKKSATKDSKSPTPQSSTTNKTAIFTPNSANNPAGRVIRKAIRTQPPAGRTTSQSSTTSTSTIARFQDSSLQAEQKKPPAHVISIFPSIEESHKSKLTIYFKKQVERALAISTKKTKQPEASQTTTQAVTANASSQRKKELETETAATTTSASTLQNREASAAVLMPLPQATNPPPQASQATTKETEELSKQDEEEWRKILQQKTLSSLKFNKKAVRNFNLEGNVHISLFNCTGKKTAITRHYDTNSPMTASLSNLKGYGVEFFHAGKLVSVRDNETPRNHIIFVNPKNSNTKILTYLNADQNFCIYTSNRTVVTITRLYLPDHPTEFYNLNDDRNFSKIASLDTILVSTPSVMSRADQEDWNQIFSNPLFAVLKDRRVPQTLCLMEAAEKMNIKIDVMTFGHFDLTLVEKYDTSGSLIHYELEIEEHTRDGLRILGRVLAYDKSGRLHLKVQQNATIKLLVYINKQGKLCIYSYEKGKENNALVVNSDLTAIIESTNSSTSSYNLKPDPKYI